MQQKWRNHYDKEQDNNCRQERYATVNGLNMYYEIHGEQTAGPASRALGTIDISRKASLSLAKTRQVIAVEQQVTGARRHRSLRCT
jgi:hypothetical protein